MFFLSCVLVWMVWQNVGTSSSRTSEEQKRVAKDLVEEALGSTMNGEAADNIYK